MWEVVPQVIGDSEFVVRRIRKRPASEREQVERDLDPDALVNMAPVYALTFCHKRDREALFRITARWNQGVLRFNLTEPDGHSSGSIATDHFFTTTLPERLGDIGFVGAVAAAYAEALPE